MLPPEPLPALRRRTWGGMADLCHRNPTVYDAIMAHANMLITEIGFDGFRFDFVKGYGAWMIRVDPRTPVRARRAAGVPVRRRRIVERGQRDRRLAGRDQPLLRQPDLRVRFPAALPAEGPVRQLRLFAAPPGRTGGTVMAERPDRAVTFVDNHDFRGGDSRPIINDKLMAYAFILTHPGYPCVFWQDYFEAGAGPPRRTRAASPRWSRAHERNAGGDASSATSTTICTSWSGRAGRPQPGAGVRAQQPRRSAGTARIVDTSRREHRVPSRRLVRPRRRASREPDRDRPRRPGRVLGPPARLRRLRPHVGGRPLTRKPAARRPLPAARGEAQNGSGPRARRAADRSRIRSGPFSPLAGRRLG